MKFLFALSLMVFLISCSDDNAKGKRLTTDSLPAQQFTISTDRDTTLQTINGALLKIPKGAIVSEEGTTATLEIKEAYSMEQMIKSGLTTSTNGEPLSSGGMIYINAVAGQKLKITQAIKVALPTKYIVEGMQLYKGDTSNGTLNWTDPKPIEETEQMKSIASGRNLFQASCTTCHAIGRSLSGPDLAHFEKRLEKAELGGRRQSNKLIWDHNFVSYSTEQEYYDARHSKDSTKVDLSDNIYYHPNLYVCNLQSMYGGAIGPPFPAFGKKEWKSIYDYIQTESDRLNLPLPIQAYLGDCVDSCKLYSETVKNLNELKSMSEEKRKQLIEDNGDMVSNTNVNMPQSLPTGPTVPVPAPKFEDMVSPGNFGAEYYQFTIESFGWYNIDILLKNLPGIEPSELFVRIQGEFREKTELFLIIPSLKLNTEGGKTGNKDEYAFYTKDGHIPLPQNEQAYILAVTESGGTFAYALSGFTTSKQQSITIELKSATQEEFTKALSVFEGQGLKINVKDAINAKEIRAKDADLKKINEQLKDAEGLKPKGCNCDCGSVTDTTVFVLMK